LNLAQTSVAKSRPSVL